MWQLKHKKYCIYTFFIFISCHDECSLIVVFELAVRPNVIDTGLSNIIVDAEPAIKKAKAVKLNIATLRAFDSDAFPSLLA